MNFDELAKRYRNDPTFFKLVSYCYQLLYETHCTVSELRDAAMFAAYKFESEHVRRVWSSGLEVRP